MSDLIICTMNIFKIYLRNLSRNKIFSLITIGSFTISLSIVILLSCYLISEFSYNKHIPKLDNIYRITTSNNDTRIPEQAKDILIDQIPEFETASILTTNEETIIYNNNVFHGKTINSDEELFKLLSIKFISGNPKGIFNNINNVVITKSFALKLFGNKNPIGKVITVSHFTELTVAGVIEDFQEKSSINGELICSTDLKIRYSSSCYNNDCTYFYETFVLLKPDTDLHSINSKVNALIPAYRGSDNITYSLSPYKHLYFNTSFHDGFQHANIKLIKLLIWLTLVLLSLSVFNYINLSVAQNSNRLKEFGIKQILGNKRLQVYQTFVAEALITTFTSALLASIIAFPLKPIFVNIFGKNFVIKSIFESPIAIISITVLLIFISMISSLYPAFIATKVKAQNLMQNQHYIKVNKYDFRKLITIIQFTATTIVIISIIVISKQIHYIETTDLGYNSEHVILIPTGWQAESKVNTVRSALKTISGVKEVTHTHGALGQIWNNSANENGTVSIIASDESFINTFQIPILKGRNFRENEKNNVCLINKSTMKQEGWNTFEGQNLFGCKVIGILDDFHFQDLHSKIGALMITNENNISNFVVRLHPSNTTKTLAQIEQVYKKTLPDFEYSYQFYDDFLNSFYHQEQKIAKAIKYIALIAIFISCIGLLGFIEYSAKSRVKEIGIRKVNGANTFEIITMLNKNIFKWVIISFSIAAPIAYYIMNKWLENFAYKTNLSVWIFACAGLIALTIAMVSVSWKSYKAATSNPVKSLKYE